MSEVILNRATINPIQYCVVDNDNGPVCYCYDEDDAKKLVDGLNRVNNIDDKTELEDKGYYRFAYEDMRQYPSDGHLPALIMAQLALGFFSAPKSE